MKDTIVADLVLREAQVGADSRPLPEGKKLMVVFGVAVVDESAVVDEVRFKALGRLREKTLKLEALSASKVPKAYSAWSAEDMLREMEWLFPSPEHTRSLKALRTTEVALGIVSSGYKYSPDEALKVTKALNKMKRTLPTHDVMRQVITAVVNTIKGTAK